MKKMLAAALILCVVLFSGNYIYTKQHGTQFNQLEPYEVPFEDAKLIDTKVEGKTGVKIEVYTIDEWEN